MGWFRGSLVAYSTEAKSLLDVPPGPVMTAECAAQMALGARSLLDADVAWRSPGVGGPTRRRIASPGPSSRLLPARGTSGCSR